jgi:hypothetical protein
MDFDFPFELTIGSESSEKRWARGLSLVPTIRSEIERAIGGEGRTGIASVLDIPFALAVRCERLDEIGIAKINDAGSVYNRRAYSRRTPAAPGRGGE